MKVFFIILAPDRHQVIKAAKAREDTAFQVSASLSVRTVLFFDEGGNIVGQFVLDNILGWFEASADG